jgi:hypothetical protein
MADPLPDDAWVLCAVPHCCEPALSSDRSDERPAEFCARHASDVIAFRQWLDTPWHRYPSRSFDRARDGWTVEIAPQC